MKSALIALGSALATIGAIEFGLRASDLGQKLAHENFYTVKANWFSDSPGFDITVVGDSRVLHGVDPIAIERAVKSERGENLRVYNAGLSGAPPMAHLAWIRRFLTHPHRPRMVVLSISPYMFSSRIAHDPSRESLTSVFRIQDVPFMALAGAPSGDLATVAASDLFASVRYRPRLLEVLFDHSAPRDGAAPGTQGFYPNGEVDPGEQRARATGRAQGYRTEMERPSTFGNEQVGYFREGLRELRAAGVRIVVINSPAATQIDVAYGRNSIYREHMAFVQAMARNYGAVYSDAQHSPAVTDEDFNDGDHFGSDGAARFSTWLAHEVLVPALGGARTNRSPACRTVFAFDTPALEGWSTTGDLRETVRVQARRGEQPVNGYRGRSFVTTYGPRRDDNIGELISPPFVLDGSTVRVRVGGGRSAQLDAMLDVDGEPVRHARGRDSETLEDTTWDVAQWRGRTARLHVRDAATGDWGHILVDDVAVCP